MSDVNSLAFAKNVLPPPPEVQPNAVECSLICKHKFFVISAHKSNRLVRRGRAALVDTLQGLLFSTSFVHP